MRKRTVPVPSCSRILAIEEGAKMQLKDLIVYVALVYIQQDTIGIRESTEEDRASFASIASPAPSTRHFLLLLRGVNVKIKVLQSTFQYFFSNFRFA